MKKVGALMTVLIGILLFVFVVIAIPGIRDWLRCKNMESIKSVIIYENPVYDRDHSKDDIVNN